MIWYSEGPKLNNFAFREVIMPGQVQLLLGVTLFMSLSFAVKVETKSFLPGSVSTSSTSSALKAPYDSSGRGSDLNLGSSEGERTVWTTISPSRNYLVSQPVASTSSSPNASQNWQNLPSKFQQTSTSSGVSSDSTSSSYSTSVTPVSTFSSLSNPGSFPSNFPVSNTKPVPTTPIVSSLSSVSKSSPTSSSWQSFPSSSLSSNVSLSSRRSGSSPFSFSNSNLMPMSNSNSISRSSTASSSFATSVASQPSIRTQPYPLSNSSLSSQTYPSARSQETTSSQSPSVSQPTRFSSSSNPAVVIGPIGPPTIVSRVFTAPELSRFPSYPPGVGVSTLRSVVRIPEVLLGPNSSFSAEIIPPRAVPLDPSKPPSVTYSLGNEISGSFSRNSVEEVSNSVNRFSLNIGQGSIVSSGGRTVPSTQGQVGNGTLLAASRVGSP